ncbi:MAG: tRNA (cytidine(34)-2'-O)-methyltransferase [Eubacterium sp.]|nr:tRNA (cytidine(34)-2'-O)-methyltransferase [Eubacterium sp.]SEF64324.1 tRNA (cytidine/uridine-2'-O-)-methyltransferase [Eubacterium ruminantium]
MINIVLFEPEMPANTGHIGRTCVITGAKLHLIEPLGFHLSEKAVKRAGLDYWPRLNYEVYLDYNDFLKKNPDAEGNMFFATTKARNRYTDVNYADGCYIMFGKESAGIPEEILVEHPESCVRIPMKPEERSLNLADSVAIVTFEALRQLDFAGLESSGELHRLSW